MRRYYKLYINIFTLEIYL